ncbi:MAG: hypothetical protein PHP89_01790 [Candidatus Omnitrophica bacterium]|jgi:hypothetical protein|nr:hypothetical protein [Candidatus Omnitrophota bacterium]MDD3987966.1 hypothetical protein [Candidatus Omnitrophota bacterium]MDD4982253.1 hypothetical protein [Candidatus Omnitrophota bacterium]
MNGGKQIIILQAILLFFTLIASSGCTFIIKDEQVSRYYGIDEPRGKEFLDKIEKKQQEIYTKP